MIRRSENMERFVQESVRGGIGSAKRATLLSPGEYKGHCRLVGTIQLDPGSSIGSHVHTDEEEIFYILEGEATYDDNGTVEQMKAGDVCLTTSGQNHSIVNSGTGPLVLLALVLLYT